MRRRLGTAAQRARDGVQFDADQNARRLVELLLDGGRTEAAGEPSRRLISRRRHAGDDGVGGTDRVTTAPGAHDGTVAHAPPRGAR